MSSRRLLLVIGAVAVLALVGGLLFMLRSDERPTSETMRPAVPPTSTPVASTPSPSVAPPAPTPAETPPPAETPSPARPIPGPEEGRLIVRDHRDGGPTAPPSPLDSTTLAEARQTLGPMIRACAPLLKDGKPARMVVHARFRVGGGRVTASEVSVTDAAELGDGYVSCVKEAYARLSTDPPPDQKDGEDLVHMPWTVP